MIQRYAEAEDRIIALKEKSSHKFSFYFLVLYAFLSGFVFIEPSPAEILFVLFLPFSLIGFSTTRQIIYQFLLLIIPMIISSYVGLIMGFFNLRFVIIDLYLFSFFLLTSSLAYRLKKFLTENEIMKSIMSFWVLAGAINIVVGIFAYLTGRTIILGTEIIKFGIRLKGFFKDPNVLGPFLVPVSVYFLYLLIIDNRHRIKSFLNFTFFSLGVLLTFSRAAWLNYFVAVFCLMLVLFVKKRKTRAKIFIVALILISALVSLIAISKDVYVLGTNLYDFFTARLGLQEYDTSRFEAQKEFSDILSYNLLSLFFGIGPGNYENFSKMATHSLFARYIGERGLFGIITFLAFIFTIVYNLRKANYKEILIPVLLGQLVNSLFIDSLHWRHLWLLITLTLL